MRRKEHIKAKEITFTVSFEPAEEGGYTVTVPALPGIVTEGDTLEEARGRAKEAIQCHLESIELDHLPMPGEHYSTEPLRETLTVELKAA